MFSSSVGVAGSYACVTSYFQCGYDITPWMSIQKAMLILVEKPAIDAELFKLLDRYRSGILSEVARNVPRLLLWSRSRQCTDPRDRIYGLLGLMSPSIAKIVDPHYDEPWCHAYRKMLLAQSKYFGVYLFSDAVR